MQQVEHKNVDNTFSIGCHYLQQFYTLKNYFLLGFSNVIKKMVRYQKAQKNHITHLF